MSADKVAGKKQTPANTRKLVPDWLRNIRTTGKPDKDHSDDSSLKMGKCVKYLLMTLNLGVFVAGSIFFVAGMLLKLDTGFLHVNVVKLWNNIRYNGVYLGTIADLVTLWMIIFGGLLMIIAILGWFGTWKKIRTCLFTYVIVIVMLIFAEATMAALWVTMRGRSTEWMKGRMLRLLEDYNGPGYTDDISQGWNYMFTGAQCCGIRAQYDSNTQNDFDEQDSPWYTTNRVSSGNGEQVPATCCHGVTMDNYADYINSETCTSTAGGPTNFYTEGCFDKLVWTINTYSLIVLITAAIVFVMQVTAILATCLRLEKTKPKEIGHPPPGPPPYVSIDAVLKNKKTKK